MYSRPNVSTLQSSVFIRGDLKLQRGFLYTQEVASFANKVEIFLWLAFLTINCISIAQRTRGCSNSKRFYNVMVDWCTEIGTAKNMFISQKLWFDIQSMCLGVLGFKSLVSFKLERFPNAVIKPAITNQDCVENHFCQVTSCNGQNNNPTYLQQQPTQNSIRMAKQ